MWLLTLRTVCRIWLCKRRARPSHYCHCRCVRDSVSATETILCGAAANASWERMCVCVCVGARYVNAASWLFCRAGTIGASGDVPTKPDLISKWKQLHEGKCVRAVHMFDKQQWTTNQDARSNRILSFSSNEVSGSLHSLVTNWMLKMKKPTKSYNGIKWAAFAYRIRMQ